MTKFSCYKVLLPIAFFFSNFRFSTINILILWKFIINFDYLIYKIFCRLKLNFKIFSWKLKIGILNQIFWLLKQFFNLNEQFREIIDSKWQLLKKCQSMSIRPNIMACWQSRNITVISLWLIRNSVLIKKGKLPIMNDFFHA